jgi:hypothetical protein
MNKDDVSRTKALLHTYYGIVHLSQELARIRVRRVTFGTALISNLEPLGGAWFWAILIVLSPFMIVYLSTLGTRWADVLILGFGTFLNYAFILLNIGPWYARFTFKVTTEDERMGLEAARFIANRVSLLIVLPVLLLIILVVGSLSYELGITLLFGLTAFDLATSTYAQTGFTLRNLGDVGNLSGALMGKTNILVRNIENLTSDLVQRIADMGLERSEIEHLARLSDNDLHRRQVDLETVNFRLALFTIVVTLLLSQQILELVIRASLALNDFLWVFGNTASQILGFTGMFAAILSTWIYIMLWWYLINIFWTVMFQLSSALLFIYFNEYRAAYSLQQALTLLSFTAIHETSPNQGTGFL